jgi:large subunit ribosomal protein L25
LVIPKQVQRDPIRGFIEHADLLIVKKGQKVTVDIPVHLLGEAFPGSLVVQENTSIAVEAEATNIPDYTEVSIEGLKPGQQLHASDIPLPEGTELAIDPDLLIVNITSAPTDAELDAELDEAVAVAGDSTEATEPAADGDASEGEPAAESADKE